MDCPADSRFGAKDWVDTQPEIVKYGRSGTRFVPMGHRIAARYHGLFHLARVTIHDRWVARPTFRAPSRFRGARRRPARRAEDATRKGLFFNVQSTSSFVNTGWTGDKLMTASPFF